MPFDEILIYAIDKFSAPGASSPGLLSGLLLVASAAVWVKKYIINGNFNRYFALKEKELSSQNSVCSHLEDVNKKLETVIEEQRKLLQEAGK